ncbi:MAG: LysM peptidoglycan-binding domain-containing protein [Pseudobdellovibrionaceae bacterium]
MSFINNAKEGCRLLFPHDILRPRGVGMNAKFLLAVTLLFSIASWAQAPYVVREGDTLLNIADKMIGTTDKKDPRRYEYAKKIRALNPQIHDPNSLEPGQTLNLPAQANSTHAQREVHPALESAPEPVQTPTRELAPAPGLVPAPAPTHTSAPEEHTAPAHSSTKTQAHAEHSAQPHASEHHDFIFIQPRYQTLKLKTTNVVTHTKATMKAQSSYGLDLQYGKILNDDFHLLFQAGITQTIFNDISAGTVNHKSETLKSFALGIAYEATSTLHLDLMAMYADRTFLLPVTATEHELEAVSIPGAELNISWDLYSGDSNIFGISAIGEYIGAVKKHGVEYKAAMEPLGALYWKSKYGHDDVNYKVTLTYKHGHQKTNISEQSEDLGIFGLGFYF